MIDLRDSFKNLLDDFGVNVLYLRHSKFIKCKCYNELYKVGDTNCISCLGSGKLLGIKSIKCIIKNTLGDYERIKSGYQISKDTTVYFSDKFNPNGEDFIITYKTNKDGYISEIDEIYEITYTNITRGDGGRVEFYSVKATLRNDKKTLFDKLIRNMNHNTKKSLKNGRWINGNTI